MMAPCMWAAAANVDPAFSPLFAELRAEGIGALAGPNWDTTAICANENLSDAACTFAGYIPETQQPTSLKVFGHFNQMAVAQR